MALWPLGYPRRSVAASMQALDEARGIGHAFTLTFALGARTILSAGLGADWRQATTDADQALTHSIEHGFPLYQCWGLFYQGAALVRCGDPRRGVELMRGALASAGKINAGATRTVHLGHLAAAHASLGEPEVGVGLLGEAILAVEQTEERLFEAELHRMRGEMLLASGKGEAEAALHRALATLSRAVQSRGANQERSDPQFQPRRLLQCQLGPQPWAMRSTRRVESCAGLVSRGKSGSH
jgi:predicted ATPase